MSIRHDTIRIDRSYPVPPAQVLLAWAEPAARERWFVCEEGWESEYSQDFRVGGQEELARTGGRRPP
ncbi:MAG: hypothetical protein AB7O95_17710 [Geminicoccaceae bacterium]